MALKGTYDAVRQAIQDLIAPELERIKGQMAVLDAKIGAVDAKIDAMEMKLGAKIATVEAKVEAVDIKIEAVRSEVRSFEKRLDETLNIRERLAAIEATLRTGQHP